MWSHACAAGRIVVSKDEDSIALASRAGDSGRLIWVRLGNCRNAALLEGFAKLHDQPVQAFESGQRVAELR